MRLLLLTLLVNSVWAAEIKYSRQDPAILKAFVDGVPKTLSLYAAHVCGSGPGEERFEPDMVLFAAADFAAVQDSAAAAFAAEASKKTSLKYKAVTVVINGIEYAGFLIVGLATGNVLVIPKLVTGLVAVGTALVPRLLKRKDELAHQPKPQGWIEPGMTERILGPTKCDHFTFLMSSDAPNIFPAHVDPVYLAPPASAAPPQVAPALSIPVPTRTERMIPIRDEMTAAEYILAVLHPDAVR